METSTRSLVRPRTAGALLVAMALTTLLLAARATAAGGGVVVAVHRTALGAILTTAQDRTLYMFAADKRGKSVCYGQCAAFWPPLLTDGKPVAAPGVKSTLLGVTTRKDGSHQVTYAGHPLYRFAEDARAGQVRGEGVNAGGGLWWVLSPAGTVVKKAQATAGPSATTTTTTTTQTSSGGGGYGRYGS